MYLQVSLQLHSCFLFSAILLCLLKLFHKFHSHLEGMVNTPKKFIGLEILESFTFQRVTKFIVVLLLTAEFQHRWTSGAEYIIGHFWPFVAYVQPYPPLGIFWGPGKNPRGRQAQASEQNKMPAKAQAQWHSMDEGISDMFHGCFMLVLRINMHIVFFSESAKACV